MNTLPRAITAEFFPDPETYTTLRSQWRMLMNSDSKRDLMAEHHLLYLVLLGKDWRRGFTPIANERKLANGAFQGWVLFHTLRALHNSFNEQRLLAPFEGIVTSEMLQRVRRVVPLPNSYSYRAADFTPKGFPFEAYTLPETLSATTAQ